MPYRYYPGSIGEGRVTTSLDTATSWAKNGHAVEFFVDDTVYAILTWGEQGLVRKIAKTVAHECEVILVSFRDKRVISRRKVVTESVVAA